MSACGSRISACGSRISEASDKSYLSPQVAAAWFSETSDRLRVLRIFVAAGKAIQECSDPDNARKEWADICEMLPTLQESCDAVCSFVQDFIDAHPKCHPAAPPPAAYLTAAQPSATWYPQKAALLYADVSKANSPSGAHLQHTGAHSQIATTQLNAARPVQAASRANPPARSIGTREATGLPSSETNSREGKKIGKKIRTSPDARKSLVPIPVWLNVPPSELKLNFSHYWIWQTGRIGAPVNKIVLWVVLQHLGKFSFAYLPKVRESARFLMKSLGLIAPEEEKKTESCSKLQYAWKSVVDVVLWDKQICIGEEINNSQKNQIKKQNPFVLMIRPNQTLQPNQRFCLVGKGTWNQEEVQCWQEVTRRHTKIAQPGQSAKGRDIGGGGDERMQDSDQGESEVDEGREITRGGDAEGSKQGESAFDEEDISNNVEGMDLDSAKHDQIADQIENGGAEAAEAMNTDYAGAAESADLCAGGDEVSCGVERAQEEAQESEKLMSDDSVCGMVNGEGSEMTRTGPLFDEPFSLGTENTPRPPGSMTSELAENVLADACSGNLRKGQGDPSNGAELETCAESKNCVSYLLYSSSNRADNGRGGHEMNQSSEQWNTEEDSRDSTYRRIDMILPESVLFEHQIVSEGGSNGDAMNTEDTEVAVAAEAGDHCEGGDEARESVSVGGTVDGERSEMNGSGSFCEKSLGTENSTPDTSDSIASELAEELLASECARNLVQGDPSNGAELETCAESKNCVSYLLSSSSNRADNGRGAMR